MSAVSVNPATERRAELVALYRRLSEGHACPLASTRTRLVFGSGNADADLMFVGEAPGAEEDRQGKPFVGRAGKLLDALLDEIGLRREDTFVANVLKCKPPGNRDPLPEEIAECSPWLFRQIELIEPLVICTLGNFATKLLTGSRVGITRVHGTAQTHELAGRSVQLFPIFHPAAALRTEAVRELLRTDFAGLPALLDEAWANERTEGPEDPATAPELGPGLPKPESLLDEGGVPTDAAPGDAEADPAAPVGERSQLDLFG